MRDRGDGWCTLLSFLTIFRHRTGAERRLLFPNLQNARTLFGTNLARPNCSNKCGLADNVERLEERLERYHDLTEIRDQEIQGRRCQQPEAAEYGEREKLGSFD